MAAPDWVRSGYGGARELGRGMWCSELLAYALIGGGRAAGLRPSALGKAAAAHASGEAVVVLAHVERGVTASTGATLLGTIRRAMHG